MMLPDDADAISKDLVYDAVINARTKSVIPLQSDDGRSKIYAIDLIGDLWSDFVHFLTEAKNAHVSRDVRSRNRLLRAALSCLFSHIDGLVSMVADGINRHELDAAAGAWQADTKRSKGRPPIWARAERPSLCQKMFMLRDHAWYQKRRRMPYVRTDLKILRDILNHPSITKSREDPVTGNTVIYDAVALYFLPLREVEVAARYLDGWLDALCKVYGVERFCATAELCDQLAKAYSQIMGRPGDNWSTPGSI